MKTAKTRFTDYACPPRRVVRKCGLVLPIVEKVSLAAAFQKVQLSSSFVLINVYALERVTALQYSNMKMITKFIEISLQTE